MSDVAPLPHPDQNAELRARMEAANINADTGMATDYLNHFNEVSMLIEMTISTPDMIAEAKDWQPRSYAEHFRASGFGETDFIIHCYESMEPRLKAFFDTEVDKLNELLLDTIQTAQGMNEQRRMYELPMNVQEIQGQIGKLYGIINGARGLDQAGVDEELSQDAIDDLFD